MKIRSVLPTRDGSLPPHTNDSAKQGDVPREPNALDHTSYHGLGAKEELADIDESDIADEGHGHRG
jgi:hypothetical protein